MDDVIECAIMMGEWHQPPAKGMLCRRQPVGLLLHQQVCYGYNIIASFFFPEQETSMMNCSVTN
jgi:hypothetical protein